MRRYPWLALLLALALLSGCGGQAGGETEAPKDSGNTLTVVATVFPVYDWLRQIAGEGTVELSLLMDQGLDPHSYQPTPEDIVRIANCNLFVYVGGASDDWVQDVLTKQEPLSVNLLDLLGEGAKEEVLTEGMQAEEEAEYDEHVWLSLRNAAFYCRALAEILGELDPEHRQTFTANAETYTVELDRLDQAYQAAVDSAPGHTLLFGDRFPFRYLTDDYALDAYAAFPGCSAETEASFETILFLSRKVDELALPAVLILENSDGKIARTIVENTETGTARVLRMNSMQSVSASDVENGSTYLGTMGENLRTLRQALGVRE